MLRIAMLVRDFRPYHRARLVALARELGPNRVLAILLMSGGSPVQGTDELLSAGIRAVRIDSRQDWGRTLRTALEEYRPRCVAIPGWSDPASQDAALWASAQSVPVVLMSDSAAGDAPRGGMREFVKSRVLGLASAVFVAGSRHSEYVNRLAPWIRRIATGYDVVDNAYFAREASQVRFAERRRRHEYQLPDRYFLSVMRLVPKKNPMGLLDEYARYAERCDGEPMPLLVVGRGSLLEPAQAKCAELDLSSLVSFRGHVGYEELPAYYALARALVLPSFVEQWGLVVNEALASGLPVIVSDRCGCVPELVDSSGAGWRFDPHTPGDLAERMQEMVALSKSEWQDMSDAAGPAVREFSPETFAKTLVGLAEAACRAELRSTRTSRLIVGLVRRLRPHQQPANNI